MTPVQDELRQERVSLEAKLEVLQRENEELRKERDEKDKAERLVGAALRQRAEDLSRQLAEARAEMARRDVALQFYADISKYPAPLTGGLGALWSDCGQIARAALTASAPKADGWREIPVTDETVDYVMRYGGRCRECADAMGVCPTSGLPCIADEARSAIRHTLRAINYGYGNGFLPLPAAPTATGGRG